MSKYHSKKTTVDGITFDSIREANRWQELRILERAGEIKNLRRQVKFTILEGYEIAGRKVSPVQYIADFYYTDTKTGKRVIEDAKGYRTDVYKLKKKMFEKRYGIEITEI
jgi:hypothetical protein